MGKGRGTCASKQDESVNQQHHPIDATTSKHATTSSSASAHHNPIHSTAAARTINVDQASHASRTSASATTTTNANLNVNSATAASSAPTNNNNNINNNNGTASNGHLHTITSTSTATTSSGPNATPSDVRFDRHSSQGTSSQPQPSTDASSSAATHATTATTNASNGGRALSTLTRQASTTTPQPPSPSRTMSDQDVVSYLRNVPLLRKLTPTELDSLARALVEQSFDAGATIVREGDEGHEFFIIKKGHARVTKYNAENKSEAELCVLRPSDYFGEQALVNNSTRMATITAVDQVVCFTMSREKFVQLFGQDRLNITFVKRAAVSAETYNPEAREGNSVISNENVYKDQTQKDMLLNVVASSILFANLSAEQKSAVVDTMALQKVQAGVRIISQGDLGDHFYVVERGHFDIFVATKDELARSDPKDKALGRKVASRGFAECFGELALLYNAPRAATVVATVDSMVWVLDRWTFRKILTNVGDKKLREYETFLRGVQSFEVLLDYERARIAEALEEVSFQDNHHIVRQGEQGDTFFILKSGNVRVTMRDDATGEEKEVARYHTGNFFGERALVNNEKRAATVTSVGAVTCLYLKRDAFSLLLGPLEDIFRARVQGYSSPRAEPSLTTIQLQTPTAGSKDPHLSVPSPSGVPVLTSGNATGASAGNAGGAATGAAPVIVPGVSATAVATASASAAAAAPALPSQRDYRVKDILFKDLLVIGTLGKGSFGVVQLVRHTKTGKTYALKTVNKAMIAQLGQEEHMQNEKNAMQSLSHPFLVRLYCTYRDETNVYLLLEVSLGGELFTLLRGRTLFDEPTARFYAAGVVLAFEYMHSKGYIYRDLKPENLLLDDRGYIKITDFGFAKLVGDNRTWTLCGTPDYLAPEVVSGQGHGKAVDWWTLGILIYEMLASYPPFYDEDPMRTYAKIMQCQVAFPSHFSRSAVDLIRRLLHPKATKRLGAIAGGAQAVKDHPFFLGFDWNGFLQYKMRAPIVLPVKHPEDMSNFEKYPAETNKGPPYVPNPKHPDWDKDF